MKAAQPVKIGAWLLIGMNLLMSFGSIWIFMRMAPAIQVIIDQNEVSLQSCETMLASLLYLKEDGKADSEKIFEFNTALTKAKNNVTEKEEPAILAEIATHSAKAFQGDLEARHQTINTIIELGTINRAAMRRADTKAQQLGYAGAWGVVFMATITFTIGMMFLHSLRRNLSEPMEEINAVVVAFREGDRMRRCAMKTPSYRIRKIFINVNELLDMIDFTEPNITIHKKNMHQLHEDAGPDT